MRTSKRILFLFLTFFIVHAAVAVVEAALIFDVCANEAKRRVSSMSFT